MNRKDRKELWELYQNFGKFKFHIMAMLGQIRQNENAEQAESALFYMNRESEKITNILLRQLQINSGKLKNDLKKKL